MVTTIGDIYLGIRHRARLKRLLKAKEMKVMGPIKLDSKIMKQGSSWGYNYDSTDGCGHNSTADKKDSTLTSKEITLNTMSKMDAERAKPGSKNPGVDKSFLAKGEPSMDTTGHGKLTRKLKD